MNPVWIASLVLLSVTLFASGAAITCSGGAQLFTIPEDSTEASTVLTCPGFTLSPTVAGEAAIFRDPDGSLSDFVLLANVSGAAQFTFVSDLETGPPLTLPPNPILQTVIEPNPFVIVATSTTGAKLQFTFTSDVNESPTGPSETIQVAPIPEPPPLTLAGLGVLLVMCGFYLRRRSFRHQAGQN
jgi:hypothetical protein